MRDELAGELRPEPQGAASVALNGHTMEEVERTPVVSLRNNSMYKQSLEEGEPDDLLCFNVGGKKFFVMRRSIDLFPESRLGLLLRAAPADRLRYCDKFLPGEVPEFYFDVNWKGFGDVLDVYRVGRLHLNSAGLCPIRVTALLTYWQIDELLLDPCCALKYYPDNDECLREIESQIDADRRLQERLMLEDFGPSFAGRVRKMLWCLTEYPETSCAARVYAFTSLLFVMGSTILFVLATIPELDEYYLEDLVTANKSLDGRLPVDQWETGILILKVLDHTTMVFFTLEYVVRFICAPQKWKFIKSPLNIIDVLAILPYFVGFLLEGFKDTLVIGRAGKVLRLVRVMRILRVFKLVRHFAGLQSLLSTLAQVYKEIILLMCLVLVSVLTFSSLIYFAEKGSSANWSFFDTLWWGLMSITTAGNGSNVPATGMGRLIGGLTALFGVFILALPVPIILNTFAMNYRNRIWKAEVVSKKAERAELEKWAGYDNPGMGGNSAGGENPGANSNSRNHVAVAPKPSDTGPGGAPRDSRTLLAAHQDRRPSPKTVR